MNFRYKLLETTLVDGGLPGCTASGAGGGLPSLPGLRAAVVEPTSTRSTAGEGASGLDMPIAGGGAPMRAEDLWAALLVRRYLSNAVSFVLCVDYSFKDHHNLLITLFATVEEHLR